MSQAVMTSKPDSASTACTSLRKAGSPSTTRTLRFESVLSTKLLSDERTERRLQIEQPAELVRKACPVGGPALFPDGLLTTLVFQILGFLELLLEAVDASFGVHQLLAAGEERVTVGADFYAQIALMRGTGLEGVPAGADDVYFLVGGMNSGFHFR